MGEAKKICGNRTYSQIRMECSNVVVELGALPNIPSNATFLAQVHLIALHGGRWKKLLQWVLAVLSSSKKPKLRKMSFQVIVVDFAGLQECGLMYAV